MFENSKVTSITEASAEKSEHSRLALLEKSAGLIRAFGFEKGKPLASDDLVGLVDKNSQEIQAVLRQGYGEDVLPQGIVADKNVQAAFLMNIQKMVEFARVRKDGSPYYIHPQMAGYELAQHMPDDLQAAKEGFIGALLHDYFEEGDGVSREALPAMQAAFPEMGPDFAESLVMMTEPNYREKGELENKNLDLAVDYDALKESTGYGRKSLETVAFCIMLRSNRVMQLVVPVDKLANVGDCDQVQRKKTLKDAPDKASPEYREKLLENLAKTIATYRIYAENCTDPGAVKSKEALLHAVQDKIHSLAVEFPELAEVVAKRTEVFWKIMNDSVIRNRLIDQLTMYFSGLGLSDSVVSLEGQRLPAE